MTSPTAPRKRNVLFIMADQLRWDYLSCAGHPHLKTPNLDKLASRGVRFTRAYVQSPICGASRMCFYTGRYVHSHGASWNGIPLKVGEHTLGDYTRALGVQAALVGKTHMIADNEGMERLGVDPKSIIGVRVSECGFDPYERDDGLHGSGPDGRYPSPRYNRWLNERGYPGDNPWHDYANAAQGPGNTLASGWAMRNARLPARVKEEDSETPYMTDRAMDFIAEKGADPWVLHLSYIKPHWPYIAPAPYNDMYGPEHVIPAVRSDAERVDAHPVFANFMNHRVSKSFSRNEVRENVIPVYMGLIKQIDDHLGRLFQFLHDQGIADHTMIVMTSDHGDYLGDHWMGEKDLFHDASAKVPLIIYDPTPEANTTRGTTCDELVESIDLVPTILDWLGGKPAELSHRLEGRSLLPWLQGQRPPAWRDAVFSEYDYTMTPTAKALGVEPKNARLFMVADTKWKYMHAIGFRPMLFDLENDPDELIDLGASPRHENVRQTMAAKLHAWGLRFAQRTTRSDGQLRNMAGKSTRKGILIGVWDESDIAPDLWDGYPGSLPPDHRGKA